MFTLNQQRPLTTNGQTNRLDTRLQRRNKKTDPTTHKTPRRWSFPLPCPIYSYMHIHNCMDLNNIVLMRHTATDTLRAIIKITNPYSHGECTTLQGAHARKKNNTHTSTIHRASMSSLSLLSSSWARKRKRSLVWRPARKHPGGSWLSLQRVYGTTT